MLFWLSSNYIISFGWKLIYWNFWIAWYVMSLNYFWIAWYVMSLNFEQLSVKSKYRPL